MKRPKMVKVTNVTKGSKDSICTCCGGTNADK